MKRAILEQLQQDRADKRPVVLATFLNTGEQRLLYLFGKKGLKDIDPRIGEVARAALLEDRSRTIDTDEGPLFLNAFNPPLRLVLVGAVHIAQALVPMAQLAGYDVTVIDPRSAFGSSERFPGVTLSNDWPDEAMTQIRPDLRTAVVTLTHDPKIDDPALIAALRSDAFTLAHWAAGKPMRRGRSVCGRPGLRITNSSGFMALSASASEQNLRPRFRYRSSRR